MLNSSTLIARIEDAIKRSRLSKAQVATRIGVTGQAVNGWLRTGRVGKDSLMKLADLAGLPAEYFLKEDWADQSTTAAALRPIVEWSTESDLDSSQHVIIPRLEIYLSAGSASGHHVGEEPANLPLGQAFRVDFVRRKGWSASTHYSMLVKGSSMEPTVPDGSSVVVDISERVVRSGMIYAVRIDANAEPILKRLHRLPGNVIRVESDNKSPQFAAFEVRPDDLDGFEIIGRAVHVSSDL